MLARHFRFGFFSPVFDEPVSHVANYVSYPRFDTVNLLQNNLMFVYTLRQLQAGRSGGRIPVGTRYSPPVQTGPGA